jgi:hypothetical protein
MKSPLTNFSAMVRERLREQQVIMREIDGLQTSVLRDFIYQLRKGTLYYVNKRCYDFIIYT